MDALLRCESETDDGVSLGNGRSLLSISEVTSRGSSLLGKLESRAGESLPCCRKGC